MGNTATGVSNGVSVSTQILTDGSNAELGISKEVGSLKDQNVV